MWRQNGASLAGAKSILGLIPDQIRRDTQRWGWRPSGRRLGEAPHPRCYHERNLGLGAREDEWSCISFDPKENILSAELISRELEHPGHT